MGFCPPEVRRSSRIGSILGLVCNRLRKPQCFGHWGRASVALGEIRFGCGPLCLLELEPHWVPSEPCRSVHRRLGNIHSAEPQKTTGHPKTQR